MKRKSVIIEKSALMEFREYLQEKENSTATIEKYTRDIKKFIDFTGESREVSKEILLRYKEWLIERYAVSSVNSMLVALNQFLSFLELGRLKLKRIKVQRINLHQMERELSKEEFQKLVRTARSDGKEQLAMIMETMGATGIRVSELKFFRTDNIQSGVIKVCNKGKHRIVVIPTALKKKLLFYIRKNKIRSGMIFCTRTGKEKDRSNIWKEMKQAAERAGVTLEKVFPHNLRHLFARTFYKETKNLINLADLLGHSNLDVTRIYASEGIKEWRRNIEKIKILETT